MSTIDVLLISYDRPDYTRLALGNLLDVADPDVRVWVWHNGTDLQTRQVVEAFLDHPRLYRKKLRSYHGISILQNCWVNGSGYTVKRRAIQEQGLLAENQTWSDYCIDLALRGWIHGWLYPFLFEKHMDDPRSPHCRIKTDADLERRAPLSAQVNHVATVEAWLAQQRRSARLVQKAPLDPRRFRGWRRRLSGPELWRILQGLLGRRRAF